MAAERPALSIIVPACNEARLIGPCLRALRAARPVPHGGVEVIVVANGCRDDTARVARAEAAAFDAPGWRLEVIERAEAGKPGALNAGDAAARGRARVYLDADVTVDPALPAQIADALATDLPRFVSGRLRIVGEGTVSRAYARFWAQVPFMASGVPGCGLYAVNAAGRARWGAFPDIISDDTYARLAFAPQERIAVPAGYRWPVAEGIGALVRVRRRQDAGVAEIAARYPDRLANDDPRPFPIGRKLLLALRDPPGFAVYAGVALAVRLRPGGSEWSRGR